MKLRKFNKGDRVRVLNSPFAKPGPGTVSYLAKQLKETDEYAYWVSMDDEPDTIGHYIWESSLIAL